MKKKKKIDGKLRGKQIGGKVCNIIIMD